MPPLDRSEPGVFRDGAPPAYTLRDRGGLRIKIKIWVRGELVQQGLWEGTFRAVGTVKRRGETIDRCRLPRIRWYAAQTSVDPLP